MKKKIRLIVSTDFPPLDCIPGGEAYGENPEMISDLDDIQSMIRFLTYSDEFQIEGLISSASTFGNIANKSWLLSLLKVYGEVYDNLYLHSPEYPTPAYLKDVLKEGWSGAWGKEYEEIIGKGKDSEASEHIISVIDDQNPDPVWIIFWGGPRELGQALWKVKHTRSAEELRRFISKIRTYFVGLQDGSGQWMLDTFPELKTLTLYQWSGMKNTSIFNGEWLKKHIIFGHGPLGRLYPPANWNFNDEGVYEGDTPSFLYLLSGIMGLSDIDKPWQGGWGGVFEENSDNRWQCIKGMEVSISFWEDARNWDFANRIDRCTKKPEQLNHNPMVVLNGDVSNEVLYSTAKVGEQVILDSEGTYDPDGDGLRYKWFQYIPNETLLPVEIEGSERKKISLIMPDVSGEIHIILEVTDDGEPNLTRYRRMVIYKKKGDNDKSA